LSLGLLSDLASASVQFVDEELSKATELVGAVVGRWKAGDVEGAARLLRLAKVAAVDDGDGEEVADLDVVVTTMRSTLSGDERLASFEAALAGGWRERRRSGSGMRTSDRIFCLGVIPLASIPAAALLIWLGDSGMSTNHHLSFLTIGLAVTSGLWAGWRQSAAAGCAVAVGAFVGSWVALTVALVLTVAALGGG